MSDSNTQNFAYHEGRFFGKYEVESLIGRGGMAEVYKSSHPELGRPVAIKVLHPFLTDTPDFVERFRREARAAAGLRHPNLVQIYDFDVTPDGLYYMVMEYIAGQSFDGYLAQHKGPLPLPKVLDLYRQICDALQVAHENGIIHRDIKPANIMLDDRERPYLADFGIAQIIGDTRLTQSGMTSGTPQYMAPEQVTGDPVSPATDIYALGIMLYRLTTGRLPFEGGNPATVMMNHVTEPPPLPSGYVPDISPAVESVILRALSKDPEHRFPDAAALWQALAAADTGTAVPLPSAPSLPETPPVAEPDTAVTPTPEPTLVSPAGRTPSWVWLVILIGALALVAVGFLLARDNQTAENGTETAVSTIDGAEVEIPDPIPGILFVPGGSFLMGSAEGNQDERPEHEVLLAPFWIDETEVTNAAYAEFVADTGADLPLTWARPEASVWQITATEAYIAGNFENRFMYDGVGVQPVAGVLSMTLDADQETGGITAVFTGTIRPNAGTTLTGTFRIEQHTFAAGPTNPPFQEGGIGDFVTMHGSSGMELMQYPEMLAYIGTWGRADVFLDGELIYPDVGIHVMYSDDVRDDEQQFIRKADGNCCFDPADPADGSLNPEGREVSIWLFPGSSYSYNQSPTNQDGGDNDQLTWVALFFNQVQEIKAPAFTSPTFYPEGQDEHPVTGVSWEEAAAYCAWREARLPTEAEWEYAARGQDADLYPWGNNAGEAANYGDRHGETLSVASYPNAASDFGAHDMAGNVWEWTADWYDAAYYAVSAAENPTGPESGELKVARGGGFRLLDILGLDEARSTHRLPLTPETRRDDVGFRCAQSVNS